MCVPLNTYISKWENHNPAVILLALFTFLFSSTAIAQEKADVIKPIFKTDIRQPQHDLFVYTSGSINDMAITFVMDDNGLYNKNSHPNSTNFGIGFSDYISHKGKIGMNIGLGYIHERIAQDKGFWDNNGIYANWLNADANISLVWFSAGVISDIFLGSRLVNKDNFSFEGINDNCFNSISFATYLSFHFRFTNLKIEGRAGTYLIPHLNPNKLTYYNFVPTYVDSSYFEIKLYYRLFTTGNRKKSPYDIITFSK